MVGEATLHVVLDDAGDAGDADDIHEAVAHRKLLPIGIGERLRALGGAARPASNVVPLIVGAAG